jgi:hypothetical protein
VDRTPGSSDDGENSVGHGRDCTAPVYSPGV